MEESLIRLKIKNEIIQNLSQKKRMYQKEITELCRELASEPTIHKVLKDLVTDGWMDEFDELPKKGTSGGRPRKYYKLIIESEKKDHCPDCYRKYWIDSKTN
ncbi:MAG: hypothetical protein ACFFC7_34000, partial [Candidatus Hermodarchaeota archaeon]